MNNELETKEYLKKLEHLKLADSSRLRMREDLLAHARFHDVSEISVPKAVPSPFLSFFMRPAPVALVVVLLVGASAFLLDNTKPTEVTIVDETTGPVADTVTEQSSDTSASPQEGIETKSPTIATSAPVSEEEATDDVVAMNVRTKSTPTEESADMASDEMFITTELSAGTWSIEDHSADVAKRIDGLRTIVKKYDAEIAADTKAEFKTKLDTAEALRTESEGREETDARANLDKASVLIGEVESALSLLGEVVVEDGYIVGVNFE
ncbi:MAG: hypothetical protein RL538_372 [Candidatus Parcubacteria bacterium]|jgi:hypothetical protein